MESCPSLTGVLRRLTCLTIGGALILLFAGPLLTLLVMVAVCAAVGFLVWLPVHTALFGRHGVWRHALEHGKRCQACLEMAWTSGQRRWTATAQRLSSAMGRWLQVVREMVLETACGALVGTLVEVLSDAGGSGTGLGALLGAAAGAGVALGRRSKALG
jgi:hypothetical protein